MPVRLGIFVSHPVQYHVPIWRLLAEMPELDVKVFFFSDHSIRGEIDPGFGVEVAWDLPLLEGYKSEFLSRHVNMNLPMTISLPETEMFLKQGHFDWVFIAGYSYLFEIQIIRAAKKLGIPVVIRGEFTDMRPGGNPIKTFVRKRYLRWFYSHISSFCFVGNEAKSHLLKRGISNEQLFFSPYSVDSKEFERQQKLFNRKDARKELGVNEDLFVFLFSGKLIERKQLLLLLDAFALLDKKLLSRSALLVLGDGEQREVSLKKGSRILGERFLFQGFVNQSQLGKFFMASDAFVLPSKEEAWGLVVNEAMQFGLPLLLSDKIGSHKDLLQEGETGKLFKSQNAEALSRALSQMISNPESSRGMGQNGRMKIAEYSTLKSAEGIRDAVLRPL